jgi:cytoskeletal protein CcmA (bactofilin family)
LGNVDGDLEVGEHAVVKGTGTPSAIKVEGTICCAGHNKFECNVTAESLEAEGNVTVHGDLDVKENVEVEDGSLEVYGKMNAQDIDVDDKLYVSIDLHAEDIDVGGSLNVDGRVEAEKIDVGGTFETKGRLKAKSIDVGGTVLADAEVDVETLDVGGTVRVAGGRIREIDVGGSFESAGSLEFESIEVGGTVNIRGNSKGEEIEVGGSFRTEGDLEFTEIEVRKSRDNWNRHRQRIGGRWKSRSRFIEALPNIRGRRKNLFKRRNNGQEHRSRRLIRSKESNSGRAR